MGDKKGARPYKYILPRKINQVAKTVVQSSGQLIPHIFADYCNGTIEIPKLAAYNQFNLPTTCILPKVNRIAANKDIFCNLILIQNYINTLLRCIFSRLFFLTSTDCSSFCPVSHVLFYVFILNWDTVEAL